MTRQIVVFSLAGEEFALPIESVSEIIATPPRGPSRPRTPASRA